MSRDTNFYYSFLVLTPIKRRAIIAVWDFFRAVDDAVDIPAMNGTQLETHELANALESWRSELTCCFGVDSPKTLQGQRLKLHIDRFKLPRQPFDDLIDGIWMDLGVCRYKTFDDLYEYCVRVASAVGLICIEIFGYRDPKARDYAVSLGVALQLTNIIRDVQNDLASGRIYIPLDDLETFGVTENDLRMGISESVRNLLAFECKRASSFYSKAKKTLPTKDARRLVAAKIMSSIYFDILHQIKRRNYDVFSETVSISRPRRALITCYVWLQTMLCR